MSAEAGPISLLARDCRELFMKWEKRLEEESRFTELDFVADYYDRFEAWAAFLGVFSGPLASLDHRLRRHPSIQDMVMRLLDILRHNLFDVYDAEATSLQVCEPSPGSPSSLPKLDMASIDGPIIKLNKLGIWIRSLSRSDATARARTLAKALNLDLRGFEETAYLALESLYPNCTESLRQQLANSMTDRYAKLQYEAYRKLALATKSPSRDDAQTPAPPGIRPPWTPAGCAARGPKEGKHVAFVDLPASSLATDAVNKKPFRMKSEITPGSRSTAQTKSILDPGRAEPPMPVFEDDKHHAKCEWCFLTLDKNAFREKNGRRVAWSRKGREHYRQDLQPYVCVSAGCSQTFSLRTEWAEHMASSHGENWPHTIHSQPMWTCNRQHDFNAIYAFSTRGELDSHYRLLHSQDDTSRNTTAQPEIRSLRSLNACPLCLYDLNEEDELSEKDTSQGESKMGTSWKDFRLELMAEHVASHLETLMVLTLHLMSAITNINGDEGSEGSVLSNVSDPDISFVQPSWQGSEANTFEASSFAAPSPTLSITSLVGSDIIAWNDLSIPPPANLDVEDTTAVDHMLQERAKEVNRTELVGDYSQIEEYDKIDLSLGDELRLAFEKTSGKEPREFLPIEALDTIVTKDHVRTELLRTTRGIEFLPNDRIKDPLIYSLTSVLPRPDPEVLTCIRRQLQNAYICYPRESNTRFFLPRDRITAIMRFDQVVSIIQLLECYQSCTAAEINRIVEHIYCNCLKLLTISILTKNELRPLVEDGLLDECLPLATEPNTDGELLKCQTAGHKHTYLNNGLDRVERQRISHWSYAVSAPYLVRQDTGHIHYILDNNDVLPITDIMSSESSEAPDVQRPSAKQGVSQINQGLMGGYGEVKRVKIHPSHFDFKSHDSVSQYFAMKKLFESDRDSFNKELASLLSVQDKNEKHLLKLLVTFEVRSTSTETNAPATFYFLFPCADGDLWHFWKMHQSESSRLCRGAWMAEQCYELAKALAVVHNERIRQFRKFDIQENQQELYGRHGDMKASNILWFSKDDILTIANFGLGRLHSEISRSNENPQATGNTATYRAPEFDIQAHSISRACDIFSLGCVFLEFVTWFLEGWESVHTEFPNYRLERDIYDFEADTFFAIENSRTPQEQAILKPKVKAWIDKLRNSPHCNQYITDFLDLIQEKILEPTTQRRIKSPELVNKLDCFRQACRSESDYCKTQFDIPQSLVLGWSVLNFLKPVYAAYFRLSMAIQNMFTSNVWRRRRLST